MFPQTPSCLDTPSCQDTPSFLYTCVVSLQLARVVSNKGFNDIMEATLDMRLKPTPSSDMYVAVIHLAMSTRNNLFMINPIKYTLYLPNSHEYKINIQVIKVPLKSVT